MAELKNTMAAQQHTALREAGRTVVIPPGPRSFVPIKTTSLPIATAASKPKLFDDGLYFPRGDVGAQQFGRRVVSDGEDWLNNAHSEAVLELATSDRHGLRAFKAEGSEFIQYQHHDRAKNMLPPSTPKRWNDQ